MGKITFDGNIQELRKKIPYEKRVNVKIKKAKGGSLFFRVFQ